jgi:hypothetical protein
MGRFFRGPGRAFCQKYRAGPARGPKLAGRAGPPVHTNLLLEKKLAGVSDFKCFLALVHIVESECCHVVIVGIQKPFFACGVPICLHKKIIFFLVL